MSAIPRTPPPAFRVFSLYNGPRRRLSQEMLNGLDALVFDIQDVGARFYTYSCTLLSSMEESAKKGIPFFVLDRPNPITGVHVEGPVLDPNLESFVGCYEMPLRHGMTFGELAAMVNGERKLGADLRVIPMKNWERGDWFDSTGSDLGGSVAQHAQPECGDPLSGRCNAGSLEELFSGTRDRRAFRAGRSGLDQGPRVGCVFEFPAYSRSAGLSNAVSTDVFEFSRARRSRASGSWLRTGIVRQHPVRAGNWVALCRSSIRARSTGTTDRFLIGRSVGHGG